MKDDFDPVAKLIANYMIKALETNNMLHGTKLLLQILKFKVELTPV